MKLTGGTEGGGGGGGLRRTDAGLRALCLSAVWMVSGIQIILENVGLAATLVFSYSCEFQEFVASHQIPSVGFGEHTNVSNDDLPFTLPEK